MSFYIGLVRLLFLRGCSFLVHCHYYVYRSRRKNEYHAHIGSLPRKKSIWRFLAFSALLPRHYSRYRYTSEVFFVYDRWLGTDDAMLGWVMKRSVRVNSYDFVFND